MPLTAEARYWTKVNRRGPDECWPWVAALDKNGYGIFWGGDRYPHGGARMVRAHRWGYEHFIGPIPDGHQVLHTCDYPPCQNASHWFIGTGADNMADKMSKGRHRVVGGEAHHRATLTDTQVADILRRYIPNPNRHRTTGPSQQALADEYGVSRECISKIVRGIRRH